MRIAIVGAGPAGYYSAAALLDSPREPEVDVIERLPTPWGLVRQGVAPDHPNIKAVSRVFAATAAHPRFRFLGNVEVGRDLDPGELRRYYDAVVYAQGAQTDRALGIPGEDLSGSLASSAFVAWYNGHPDFAELDPDLSCATAVVVGNGNVALDVARMLVSDPATLARTDIADSALAQLAESRVREVVILGRRGPLQAAFTPPELAELGELDGVALAVDPADLPAGVPDDPRARRTLETLRAFAARPPDRAARTLRLRFCVSPLALGGSDRLERIEIGANRLETLPDGRVVATPTGRRETLSCGLVLRSVGYRGLALPGLPFDESRGTIPNEAGRVAPGVYCAGWIKRGPSGVIGTNKKDAAETVATLLADAEAGLLGRPDEPDAAALAALLASRGVRVVDERGWERIDVLERARGEAEGRPRVKLTRWDELLDAARPARAATPVGVSRSSEP